MDNINSPFFLHSGDHPGLALVSHILTGPNYNTWSRAMLMALNAKNKLSFVDDTLLQPHSGDPSSGVWSRCNSMITSWLLNAVSKEIDDILLYLDSAQVVWSDLHDRFHQSNAPLIFPIKQQLHGLPQGTLDVNTYYTRLKILWDELKHFLPVPVCQCGGMNAWMDYQEQEYVMQFLMGLNEFYARMRGQILMLDHLPFVSKMFNLVIQEERQRSISPSSLALANYLAFNVSSSPPILPTLAIVAATSFSPSKTKCDRPICSHCGVTGRT
ncbi:uncharacterized protein LOC112095167, partial [Morus notabilis]|uniref:uncharacterized protein LOC112095167 n=1 Tax=Morus notabilis TaxID=981085 RepID=UPI000CED3ADA